MSKAIPGGWELSTLENNARLITDGAHASPTTHENGKPIATVQNMRSRAIDVSSCRLISERDFNALTKGNCAPEIDDVLFSKDGTVGKTFVYRQSEKVVLLSSIAIIRLDKDQLDPEFCSQFLLSPLFYHELENAKSGSAIRRIVLNDLRKVELPKPPLPEQQKIAAILSSVDDVIEKTRAQIDKLKALKTGMMQELLTKGIGHTEFKDSPVGRVPSSWQVKSIGELLEFKNGLNKEKEYFGRGNPIVNFNDVFHGHGIRVSDLRGKVELTSSEQQRFEVAKGDVFFTRTSEVPQEIGMSAVFLDTEKNISFSGFVLRGRPIGDDLEIEFCKYCFSAGYVRTQIVSSCSYTTRALTNGTLLSQCLIAIPPKREQMDIALAIDSVDRLLLEKKKHLTKKLQIKKALMQDLLTGKVRVKVDQKESAVA